MKHEKNDYVRLPTANRLFHEAGHLAVLKGEVEGVQNDKEDFWRFTVDDFSEDIRKHWPKLRSLTYIPARPVEGPPQDDMVWIILSDDMVRRYFVISRTIDDHYSIEVEDTFMKVGGMYEHPKNEVIVAEMDADHLFYHEDFEGGLIEDLNGVMPRGKAPSSAEVLMLGRLVDELSIMYDTHPKD